MKRLHRGKKLIVLLILLTLVCPQTANAQETEGTEESTVSVNQAQNKTSLKGELVIPGKEALVASDYMLYLVNCATNTPETAPTGYKMGVFQSKVDQAYGVDGKTGAAWGYYESAPSILYASTVYDGTSLTAGRRYNYNSEAQTYTYKAGESGIYYNFQLPEGKYVVTLGFYNPWAARPVDIVMEDTTVEEDISLITEKQIEKIYTTAVTDGELNIKVHNPDRTSSHGDAMLSYIMVKVPVTYNNEFLQAEVEKYRLTKEERDQYSVQSLAKYDEAFDYAQAVASGEETTEERILSYYHKLVTRYKGLQKKKDPVTYTSFSGTNGDDWYDTNGTEIQAHGGQILPVKTGDTTTYYWYGEDKTDGYRTVDGGVRVYSSTDLYNWKDEGVALRNLTDRYDFEETYFKELYGDYSQKEKEKVLLAINDTTSVIERPKVIYNEKTGKYVMWFHADGPTETSISNYAAACAGCAVSDSPTGPFRFVDRYRLNYLEGAYSDPGMARDMNLFVDDDKTAYIIYSSEQNQTMFISKLNEDYTYLSADPSSAVSGKDYLRIPCYVSQAREAPAMFKHNHKYYLMTSACTGWGANPASYAVADSVLGEWTDQGNPCITDETICKYTDSTTFGTQSTNILKVSDGKYIYMGDRWNTKSPASNELVEPDYVWLPVEFDTHGGMVLNPRNDWKLDVYDALVPISVTTALPDYIEKGSLDSMPKTVEVQTATGSQLQTKKSAVKWEVTSGDLDKAGAYVKLTGTLTDFSNKQIRKTVFVYSKQMQYLVDCAVVLEGKDSQIHKDMAALAPLINTVPDQKYDETSGWGYVSYTGVKGYTGGMGLHAAGFYGNTSGTQVEYKVKLDAGKYTLTSGHYEWWNTGKRITDVTVSYPDSNKETKATAIGSVSFDGTKGSSGNASGDFIVPADDTTVTITFSKDEASAEAGVVSYFVIDKAPTKASDTELADLLKDPYDAAFFEEESFAKYEKALKAAQTVYKNANATDVQIEEAVTALKDAKKNLKFIHTELLVDGDTVNTNPADTFKGFGAVTCNNTSRLLMDYKEEHPKEYWEIMNLLFNEKTGAGLNHVKVEMGADVNSSSGTEPATKRTAEEKANVYRGAGWHFAADARTINPKITVEALRWGEPAWVHETGSKESDRYAARYQWFKETIDAVYDVYGIKMDYIEPCQNENASPDYEWIKYFADAMNKEKTGRYDYGSIKVVAADVHSNSANLAAAMLADKELLDAIDVIGIHYTLYGSEGLTKLNETYHKEVWYSEGIAPMINSTLRNNAEPARGGLGGNASVLDVASRMINCYKFAGAGKAPGSMTRFEFQPAVGAFYEGSQYSPKDLIGAFDPWSGYYTADAGIPMVQHFMAFTDIDWQYVDSGCYGDGTYNDGGTYVDTGTNNYLTLMDPEAEDYSIVLTNNTSKERKYVVHLNHMEKPGSMLNVWETRGPGKGEVIDANWFKKTGTIKPTVCGKESFFTFTLKAYSMATLTTLLDTGTEYKSAKSTKENTPLELPYMDDFEYTGYEKDKKGLSYLERRGNTPRYTTDQRGAFEVATDGKNHVLMQMISQDLIPSEWDVWSTNTGAECSKKPCTTLGDHNWTNYVASLDFKLDTTHKNFDGANYAGLGVRQVVSKWADEYAAYGARIYDDGRFLLLKNDASVVSKTIEKFDHKKWHNLKVKAVDNVITVYLDGKEIGAYTDTSAPVMSGRITITSGYYNTMYDNLRVDKIDGYAAVAKEHLDDSDSKIVYTGAWSFTQSGYAYFNRTRMSAGARATIYHSTKTDKEGAPNAVYYYRENSTWGSNSTNSWSGPSGNAYCSLTFTGTGISFYGLGQSTSTTADIYIDGELKKTVTYPASGSTELFVIDKLTYGEHKIKIVPKSGYASVEKFEIMDITNKNSSYFTMDFKGTGINLFGASAKSVIDVYVDGTLVDNDYAVASTGDRETSYYLRGLKDTSHQLKVVVVGGTFSLDGIDVLGSLAEKTAAENENQATQVTPTAQVTPTVQVTPAAKAVNQLKKVKVIPSAKVLYVGGSIGTSTQIRVDLPKRLTMVTKFSGSVDQKAAQEVLATYGSSNEKVAAVSDNGKIDAKGAGTAIITTTLTLQDGSKKSFTTTVKVYKAFIKLVSGNTNMKAGKKYTYAVKCYGLKPEKLLWTTSKKKVAAVDISKTKGKTKVTITAQTRGTEYLEVTAEGVTLRKKITVR